MYHWSQCRYGSPRIAKELDSIGIKVSRKFVGQIMKENHLRSIAKSKYKKTTNPSRCDSLPENRLMNKDSSIRIIVNFLLEVRK